MRAITRRALLAGTSLFSLLSVERSSAYLLVGPTRGIVTQSIASINPTNVNFIAGSGSANSLVATILVTMAPASPSFAGTFSLSGADASSFTINSSTGALHVGPADLAISTYNVNIVCTQASATNSPAVFPITINGITNTATLAFPILPFDTWIAWDVANITAGVSTTATATAVVGTATFDGSWFTNGKPLPVNGSLTVQWLLDGAPISGYLTGPPFPLTWSSIGTADGTHVVGMNVIDSTDVRYPAYLIRTTPKTIVVMNSGAINGAQRVPSCGQPFADHPPYPPQTVDYVNYPGAPTTTTVHPYPTASAPASSSTALRDSNAWYIEALNTTRTGLYEKRPQWARTSSGGVFVVQYFPESGDTVPSAYPEAQHRLSLDGGRGDNTIDPYSAIVAAPDGAWTGVDLTGRVWHVSLTGVVTTLAGPKQNRSFLSYDFLDENVSEAQLAAATTTVGTISGFDDFASGADLCYDPRNANIIYVLKTLDHCIIRIDLAGGPAATLYAGQDGVAGFANGPALSATFDQPYSIAMAADGTMYVSDYMNSAIRRISSDGATVSTLVGLQPAPTLAQVAANIDTYSSPTPVAFASAYTAFPGAIRLDSAGNIILSEPTTGCVRLINLGSQTISRIGSLGGTPLGQDSPVALWQWLAVDKAGTCGPVDDIIVMQSAGGRTQNQSFWRLSHDGSYSAVFADNGGPLSDGPRNLGATENHYPWMLAFSLTEARMLSTGFGTIGVAGWRPRLATDPPFDYGNGVGIDPVTMARGKDMWATGSCPAFPFGARPSFQVVLGSGGAGQLGSASYPTFDDIATLYPTDAALAAYIQAGMGGAVPRPEITGNDLRDIIYYIRRYALSGGLPTTVNPGPNDPDTTAPIISNVVATSLSSTSIRVTWTTNKPTIGLAAAGSPNAAATTTRYNIWSPLESGYSTTHDVTVTGLSTVTPTHYCVVSKDMAGNTTNSVDAIVASGGPSRPAPPALQGTVHHIAASGSDQTALINSTISSASSGDTIYFDSGTHVINGLITLASNLLYIGPTVQFDGIARAVLQSPGQGVFPGTPTCQIISGNNITIYGLQFNAGLVSISSCTNFTLTNCIINTQRATDGPDAMDFGGMSHGLIQWNTFQNSAGMNNNGFGASCDNVTVTRNSFLNCRQPISWSPDTNAASNSNNVFTFNYMSNVTRAGIEIQGANPNLSTHGWKINDNYVDGINSVSSDFKIGFSIVSANDAEIARNYCFFSTTQSNCAGIEFSCEPNSGSVHDNYIDGQNSPGAVGIFGGYTVSDQTTVTNNDIIKCATPFYSAGGGGVFSGNTNVDNGRPPVPVTGAGA